MTGYLSFDAPSIESVAQALICAVTPKYDRLKKLGVAHLEMPYWGRLFTAETDNAAEFVGDAMASGCKENHIKLEFRPLGKKWYGGRIERLIGTLMGKCHFLIGTTFNNPKIRDRYDSEAHATLTLTDLEGWLVAQIYAYTPAGNKRGDQGLVAFEAVVNHEHW